MIHEVRQHQKEEKIEVFCLKAALVLLCVRHEQQGDPVGEQILGSIDALFHPHVHALSGDGDEQCQGDGARYCFRKKKLRTVHGQRPVGEQVYVLVRLHAFYINVHFRYGHCESIASRFVGAYIKGVRSSVHSSADTRSRHHGVDVEELALQAAYRDRAGEHPSRALRRLRRVGQDVHQDAVRHLRLRAHDLPPVQTEVPREDSKISSAAS